jgi:hypothetical protein
VANEITFTGSLSVYKPSIMGLPGLGMSVTGQQGTMTGNYVASGTLLVPANLAGSISGVSNANPAVIRTSAAHGLVTGDTVTITGVSGPTGVNTTAVATVLSSTTFSIPVNTSGAQSYAGGGTFSTANGVAIPLGQVTAPHESWFVNLDAANSVVLANGQGNLATPTLLIGPGEQWPIPWATTATPWALAQNSAVQLEYLILSQ